jgi:Flp pilus assembly pilin Flp
MNTLVTGLYFRACNFVEREDGQDLVEYSLVVAMIGFGAIAGMEFLATGINNEFLGVATTLTSNV